MNDLFEYDLQYGSRAADGTITEHDLRRTPSHWNLWVGTSDDVVFRVVRTDHYADNCVAETVSDWYDLPRGHAIEYGTRAADGKTEPLRHHIMNTRRMHLTAFGLTRDMAGKSGDIVVRVTALDQDDDLTDAHGDWIVIPS
ncbi:hypothetical protein [Planomonospora sp. ID82291]|uniref:hypothetical protein n=1 Tax=Planomonospora sp. ID82291 TaxID=2738136 RepID=UPI0018C3858C|nr:hypothetical protein [Planomonospora sp. ID82291]MBG0818467.1 hypothetical protein [Planomonospora sp. ID82291]